MLKRVRSCFSFVAGHSDLELGSELTSPEHFTIRPVAVWERNVMLLLERIQLLGVHRCQLSHSGIDFEALQQSLPVFLGHRVSVSPGSAAWWASKTRPTLHRSTPHLGNSATEKRNQ